MNGHCCGFLEVEFLTLVERVTISFLSGADKLSLHCVEFLIRLAGYPAPCRAPGIWFRLDCRKLRLWCPIAVATTPSNRFQCRCLNLSPVKEAGWSGRLPFEPPRTRPTLKFRFSLVIFWHGRSPA